MADTQQWAQVDFVADQGSEWRRCLRFWQDAVDGTPMDFTGYEIDMHIREGVADSGAATVAHLSSRSGSDETPRIFFVGADSNGDPDPNAPEDRTTGYVMLLLSAAETRAIVPAKLPKPRQWPVEATFYYDMEWTAAGGEPQRRVGGEWVLSLEVTRR